MTRARLPILDDLSDEELQARVDAQKLDPKTEASVNTVMADRPGSSMKPAPASRQLANFQLVPLHSDFD